MLSLKNTLDGYLKNVEVIGNTVQDTNNLANIRSVGDKVEGQELYNISIQVDNCDGVSEVVEIFSPVQLEKVGSVADRIICKDGVWGVDKKVDAEIKNNVLVNTRTNSEFIPLPNDQQVKLRTFAGQTNIAFLTEIPGQIKAQVPKSLGATVNTHTKQIADLHNSLDRVKKLEETTVSTVETESNFATVDATNNGYFEGVKLEGKTLVNINDCSKSFITSQPTICYLPTSNGELHTVKPNTMYTAIVFGRTDKFNDSFIITDIMHTSQLNNNGVCLFKTFSEIDYTRKFVPHLYGSGFTEEDSKNLKLIILEGDHTNNPPGYFEGLMSVGQDVEEVSVKSVDGDGNLFDGTLFTGYINNGVANSWDSHFRTDYISVVGGAEYCSYMPEGASTYTYAQYDKNKNFIGNKYTYNSNNTNKFITDSNCRYVIITSSRENATLNELSCILKLYKDKVNDNPHQSNKKPLLYYNPTTETWEKPVLRKWDSIEKHSDGKYYYHKRSGEIVLNGSESGWAWHNADGNRTTIGMELSIENKFNEPNSQVIDIICDKLTCMTADDSFGKDLVGVASRNKLVRLRLDPSVVGGNDIPSMQNWLKANPTTLVYKLAQEEIYECTNIDLMTYSGETNYIINSGAISPKSLLKVHNNISNVVKILQEKVSLLENTFIAGLKSVLSGDMYSLATILYPEDFEQNDNTEQDIMVIPE